MWQSTNEEFWSKHSPLLFPVCGRLKDKKYTYRGIEYNMMPHGFINGVEFSVKELLDKKVTLVARASEETLAQYPFAFIVIVEDGGYGKSVCVPIMSRVLAACKEMADGEA